MSLEPTPLTSAVPPLSGPSQAEIDARDVAMLGELADITMGVARVIGQLALDKAAEGDADAAARLGSVITKVGRAVRQSIAYRRKIEDQVREQDDKRAVEETAAKAAAGGRQAFTGRALSAARKHMIENAVTRIMESQNEVLHDDLDERLDEYEYFTDFTDRPVSAFVSDICNALGLEFEWDRFEYDPWAVEEAKADPPASPFAEWWHSEYSGEDGDPGPGVRPNGHGPPLDAE
jgi:hypothetical protein